ncbi:uncharacterized protein LOC144622861 isoform X2 [Crassostrea virginica]
MAENKLLFLFILNVVDQTTVSVLGTCDPGFIGQNCSIVCRYPSYGQGCQNHCDCDKMYCDFKTGCKVCPLGYTGNRCEIPCRYPSFGKDCQSDCNCTEKLCNHIRGCHENVCASKKDSSHDVMIYSIVIGLLLLLTIIQFSVYFYLLYCFRIGRIFLTFSFKV